MKEHIFSFTSVPHTLHANPSGVTLDIIGAEASNHGRSCEEQDVCGSILANDVVIALWKLQVIIEGKEESAISASWVTNGVNWCLVGFLQQHLVPHWKKFEGRFTQIPLLQWVDC